MKQNEFFLKKRVSQGFTETKSPLMLDINKSRISFEEANSLMNLRRLRM